MCEDYQPCPQKGNPDNTCVTCKSAYTVCAQGGEVEIACVKNKTPEPTKQ